MHQENDTRELLFNAALSDTSEQANARFVLGKFLRGWFLSLSDAGFEEHQALALVSSLLTGLLKPEEQKNDAAS